MDEIEDAWNQPIKGDQAGPWCVALLDALLDGETEKARVHAQRLTSLNDPDAFLGLGLVAVSMMSDFKNGFPSDEANERLALVRKNARDSQGNRGT
jgi:hypothetical protein